VDEYYTGQNNTIQHAAVLHILKSTIQSLLANQDRKFIYVEQAFFQRYYSEQDDEGKAVIKGLVASGQLQFVNGGYCMHDEANPSYVDFVDQTTLGHAFISSEFGMSANPTVGWQVDPFGHSGENVAFGALAGFNSLFVSRADYQDIQQRTANKTLEYIWTPSRSLGPSISTFFSIMNSGLHLYFPLPNLCWDAINCNDTPFQDDENLEDYNVPSMVDMVVATMKGQAENYVGDIYITQGFDFTHEYAEEFFLNVDKMIHYVK
jgi:alpha-mannosidase